MCETRHLAIGARSIYRIVYDLLWIMMLWSRVGWFANNFHEWRSHEWKLLANHLTSDQNSLFTASHILISYMLSAEQKPQRNQWKPAIDRSPRHFCLPWVRRLCYCDATETHIVMSFWPIVFQTFLCWSRAFSRRRQVDYHSLITESDFTG